MSEQGSIPIKKVAPVADTSAIDNLDLPDEVKATLKADTTSAPSQVVEHDFPTEIIELPSEGFFYPEGSPLASGKLEMKYMTAKEEDILTSQNLIKKGVVLDKVLESLIVTPGVSPDDILIGDRNAVFVAARILAYGPKYEAKISCPKCGAEMDAVIDLTSMTNKEFNFSWVRV